MENEKKAEKFKKLAAENKKKQMWENHKMTMIIIACISVAVILMVILISTS